MLSPEDVARTLATRFARQHRRWFVELGVPSGEGWPLDVPLGRPIEQDFDTARQRLRDWVVGWERFVEARPDAPLEWVERQWPRAGRHRLPDRLRLASVDAVAQWVGEGERWRRACERKARLVARWPALTGNSVLGRAFDVLADCPDDDFERLIGLLAWTDEHPASDLYLRQLPIVGIDTKWIAGRSALVVDLLRVLRGAAGVMDLHALLGLRRPPARIRMRVLCAELRRRIGGLEDLELPVEQCAALDIAPRTVLIVENLETGLALPQMEGVIAVMKLGAAVKLVGALPWVSAATCLYWGDIDTHGFEILHRARSVIPHVRSLMMDVETLAANLSLCGTEPVQVSVQTLPLLTPAEADVFDGLLRDRWGPRLRLEQERLPWLAATARLSAAVIGH